LVRYDKMGRTSYTELITYAWMIAGRSILFSVSKNN
jgi:hypothetical protein